MPWKTLMDGDDLIKVYKAGETGYWWVLQTTDLVSSCGEKEAAEISGSRQMPIMGDLNLVPSKALVSEKSQHEVLESCGWESAPDTEEVWIEMANSYGLRVNVNTAFGGTNESALRRVLKEACVDLDGNVDHHLNRRVNMIGQTGLEHLAGDMDSCLKRAEVASEKPKPDPAAGVARTVRQRNLTGECWLVQMWGLDHCKTCEYKGSSECGGQEIRKKGKNEKGLDVPVP